MNEKFINEKIITVIKNTIETHIKLHGKNIVDFAIVDDVRRQIGYDVSRVIINEAVTQLLNTEKYKVS